MTREEHLQWCKNRALEYLDDGKAQEAITSMMSDMGKHPETEQAASNMAPIGLMAMMSGNIDEARRFIVGFN